MKDCNNCVHRDKSGHEEPCDTCERVKGNPTNWQPEGINHIGLLPCPFCGARPVIGYFKHGMSVLCSNRECVAVICRDGNPSEELRSILVEAWNRRAGE